MAIPEFLIASIFQNGAAQVAQLVAGVSAQGIGSALSPNSAMASNLSVNQKSLMNYVAEYRGYLFAAYHATHGIIQRYDRGADTWTLVHTFNVTGGFLSGFFITHTSSVQRMFLTSRTSAGQFNITYTDDSTTWVDTLAGADTSGTQEDGVPIMFNGKRYQNAWTGGAPVIVVDPLLASRTYITSPPWAIGTAPANGTADWCVHDDRLFVMTPDKFPGAAQGDWALYEYNGSTFTLNTQITDDDRLTTANAGEGQCALFVEPSTNKIIAFCNGKTAAGSLGQGTTAFALTPTGNSFSVADITTLVIPAGLQPGARGNSANYEEDRWFAFVNNADPANVDIWLWLAAGPAPGTGYSIYPWTSASSPLGTALAGPGIAYSIQQGKFGGGLGIYRAEGNQVTPERGVAVTGAYRLSYRVYGTVASQTVKLWYSVDQETPAAQASLSAQTGGSGISGGNAVTGVTGDDGATLFTLDWDLDADGVVQPDACHLVLTIEP